MTIEDNSRAVDGLGGDKPISRQQGKLSGFLNFLYDKNNGTVMGRTGRSWFEITVFYIIFYSCLAGFFAINMTIFLKTLDPNKPKYYGKGTIIGINPGMGYQPWIESEPESTLIWFSKDKPDSYEKYVKQLDKFLEKYNYTGVDNVRKCGPNENNTELEKDPCKFEAYKLLQQADCSKENAYGFKDGSPCILLTLNKLIEWEPVSYSNNSAPKEVRDRYNYTTGDVAVACEGEYIADEENMRKVDYFPPSGIDRRFFPYRFVDTYRQAFAIVKFMNPQIGVLVEVECKAYALNIIHDRTNRLGMVHFEILVDPTAEQKKKAEEEAEQSKPAATR